MPKNLDYIPHNQYTEPGYIAARPPAHRALRFKFVPMMGEQRDKINAAYREGQGTYFRVGSREIAPFIKEWSLLNGAGKPVPISVDSIRRLKPMLLDKLIDIISGAGVSDIDPDWTDEVKDVADDLTIAAGQPGADLPGEIREDADVKN